MEYIINQLVYWASSSTSLVLADDTSEIKCLQLSKTLDEIMLHRCMVEGTKSGPIIVCDKFEQMWKWKWSKTWCTFLVDLGGFWTLMFIRSPDLVFSRPCRQIDHQNKLYVVSFHMGILQDRLLASLHCKKYYLIWSRQAA